MSRKDFKTELIATPEELDLTEFKLTSRVSTRSPSSAYIFEKKVACDKYDAEGTEENCMCNRIIYNSKIFSRSGAAWPFLAPVINCKVKDYWNANNGEPIHCTAVVSEKSLSPSGKIVLSLLIHRISELQDLELEDVQITKEDIITRSQDEFIGYLEKMKRDNPKQYQWYIDRHK